MAARQLVAVTGTANGHGGTVSNAGTYDLGTTVSLEAVPDAGYQFSYWTLPDTTKSMNNPIEVLADVPHEYVATFKPLTPEITACVSDTNGVTLTWQNLAWAVNYTIYRGSANVPAQAVALETIVNDGSATYLDASGDIGQAYFYWIKAVGADVTTIKPHGAKVKIMKGRNVAGRGRGRPPGGPPRLNQARRRHPLDAERLGEGRHQRLLHD